MPNKVSGRPPQGLAPTPKKAPATPLAAALDRVLLQRGLSQRGVSLAAGLREDTVRNIVSGRSGSPRVDAVRALSDHLELDLVSLLAGDPAERPLPPGQPRMRIVSQGEWLPITRNGNPDADWRTSSDWIMPEQALGGRDWSRLRIWQSPAELVPHLRQGDYALVDTAALGVSPPGAFVISDGASVYPALVGRRGDLLRVETTAGTDEIRSDQICILGRIVGRWGML